jgi:glucosylglycerate synthase
VPLLGHPISVEAPPVEISLSRLVSSYRSGYEHFAPLWREVVNAEDFAVLRGLAERPDQEFVMPVDAYARIVYDFACTFQRWSRDKYKLVEIMTPVYYGRIAAFVRETRDMTNAEADGVVERQAEMFEAQKEHLLRRLGLWEQVTSS